ncbi:MAG: cupin domain-containing protein [Actinobacteria bacterium]|nr:cupin domain-containing protein [Actinomycetota bacterium]
MDASDVIALLELSRHPEGGWFRETWRAAGPPGERAAGTAIYYLLAEGEQSHWHRVDATEIWHFHAGDALQLGVSSDGVTTQRLVLGAAFDRMQRPQHVVPAGTWQSARALGRWTLVGCTVTPAFEFAGFELAPPGWEPGK